MFSSCKSLCTCFFPAVNRQKHTYLSSQYYTIETTAIGKLTRLRAECAFIPDGRVADQRCKMKKRRQPKGWKADLLENRPVPYPKELIFRLSSETCVGSRVCKVRASIHVCAFVQEYMCVRSYRHAACMFIYRPAA